MNPKNDAELVDPAKAGSQEACGELIRCYQHSIWGVECFPLDDRFAAEEMAQRAFLRAWLHPDLPRGRANFVPWLRRIVVGVSIDWLRVFRPDPCRPTDVATEWQLSAQTSPSESAFERLQANEPRPRIGDAVARLPPCYRLPLSTAAIDRRSRCVPSTI